MPNRVFNFNPGPATLPLSVLEEAQRELLNYKKTGMSIMEISHRSKEYELINTETEELLKELLGIPQDYRVLFLQGGASTQFAMVPLNFLPKEAVADYIITGSFAQKAYEQAVKIGQTHIAADNKSEKYTRIPTQDEINLSNSPAYVHITSNNTIFGTQWKIFPEVGNIPLIADMSSDILSKTIDVSKFALIYAGAQKNLGPAGVTIVIIRHDMLEKVPASLPAMFRYDIHAKKDSLYNTPPTFATYIVNLFLHWVKENGGLATIEKQNEEKAGYIYDALDNNPGFYKPHAVKESRSLMNITFRLPNEDLEKIFVNEAAVQDLKGLKGHREVGGIRASVYNAMPLEGCQKLADFINSFPRKFA
jgi:phosphoserine aminotransferase